MLYDTYGNKICLQDINPVTEEPYHGSTLKIWYGSNINSYMDGNHFFEAEYYENGSLDGLYEKPDPEFDNSFNKLQMYIADSFSDFEARFSTEDLSYYRDATFEP